MGWYVRCFRGTRPPLMLTPQYLARSRAAGCARPAVPPPTDGGASTGDTATAVDGAVTVGGPVAGGGGVAGPVAGPVAPSGVMALLRDASGRRNSKGGLAVGAAGANLTAPPAAAGGATPATSATPGATAPLPAAAIAAAVAAASRARRSSTGLLGLGAGHGLGAGLGAGEGRAIGPPGVALDLGAIYRDDVAEDSDAEGRQISQCLHLYQVLAPGLVGRGRLFGSHLGLKEEWQMLDEPYFSAPGAVGWQGRGGVGPGASRGKGWWTGTAPLALSQWAPCLPHTPIRMVNVAHPLQSPTARRASPVSRHPSLQPRVILAGALFAPVSSCDIALTGLELPPVTVVFCMVDAGKQFALRHRRDAHLIHHVLEAVVRSILRQVGKGEAREAEGVGRWE